MATQKISEMTEAIILQDEDYVPIVQSELNKKIKIEYLRDYNKLHNKPTLNGVTIENNKKLSDYNVVKANQGIKVNSNTNQTLELEVPSSTEMEARSAVNKAITIVTADKMAKETAHQTMSKEYQPNSQDKLKEGEKQPVSYKAVKDYVDVLENKVDENERDIEEKYSTLNSKVDENERDIEAKVTALDQKTSQKDEELEELINTNEQDIEQKVSSLQETVNNNKQNIEQKVNTLEQKVDTNETDIEEKVRVVNENIDTIEKNIDTIEENIDTIETNIDNLNNKDNEIINIIDYGGKTSNGNEYHGETSDYGLEIKKAEGNYYQEKTNGYQLFDASQLPTKTIAGVTITNNGDGSFTISGSGNTSEIFDYVYFINDVELIRKLLKVGNITAVVDEITTPRLIFQLYVNGNSTPVINLDLNSSKSKTANITQDYLDNAKSLRIGFYANASTTIQQATIKPMVYQDGDGTWERFTGGEPAPNPNYPLEPKFFEPSNAYSVGKNLFNGVLETGNISNGNNTNDTGILHSKDYINVKPNHEYCFSIDGVLNRLVVSCYDENKNYLNDTPEGIICENGAFKTLDKTKYIRFRSFREDKTKFETSEDKIQLEEGSVASSFISYSGQSTTPLNLTLRALSSGVKDTYENGVITRRIGEIEFDGSKDENFIFRSSATSPLVQIYINGVKGNTNKQSLTGYLCNKLKELTPDKLWSSTEVDKFSIGVSDGLKCLFSFRVNGATDSIESWKTYLQSNPIKVWYELAEPTIEQVDLPIIPSYYPFTNAWHDSKVDASGLIWRAKIYNALLEQEKFVEADYIKVIETNDVVSTSSNRGGAELLAIDGAYEQVTTKGYQLFDASKLPTKSQGGATVTNNGDGSFTVSGSGTLNSNFDLGVVKFKNVKKGILYSAVDNITYPFFYVDIYWGDVYKRTIVNNREKIVSTEITQDDIDNNVEIRVKIFGNSGTAIKQGVFKPIIYQDGDGSWEQFTGGQPSPNPNYVQEPKFFKPENVYSIAKNCLDHSSSDKFNSDVTIDSDGYINIVADGNYKNFFIKKENVFLKPNTIYTFVIDVKENTLISSGQQISFGETSIGKDFTYFNTGKYFDNLSVGITKFKIKTKDSFDNVVFGDRGFVSSLATSGSIKFRYAIYEGDLTNENIDFEQFKGDTTSLNIELRSLLNGVKDTYKNGVITRRVGVATFDGSDDEKWALDAYINQENTIRFIYTMPQISKNGYILCNNIRVRTTETHGDYQYIFFPANGTNIYINIEKTYVAERDVSLFKTWLQSNPITVWYELNTPTTETIDKLFIETYYPWTNIWTDSPINTFMKIGFKNRFGEFYTKKEVDELIKEAIAKIGTQMIK